MYIHVLNEKKKKKEKYLIILCIMYIMMKLETKGMTPNPLYLTVSYNNQIKKLRKKCARKRRLSASANIACWFGAFSGVFSNLFFYN